MILHVPFFNIFLPAELGKQPKFQMPILLYAYRF
jgi:hypothetical protein